MKRERRSTVVTPIVVILLVAAAVPIIRPSAFGIGSPHASGPLPSVASDPRLPAAEAPAASYSDVVRGMDEHRIASAEIDAGSGKTELAFTDGTSAKATLPVEDGTLLRDLADAGADVTVTGHPGASGKSSGGSWLVALAPPLLMIALVVTLVAIMRRRARQQAADGLIPGMNTSLRSDAHVSEVPTVRFHDVAGCDEAVEELREIVAFFHEPDRFARLGARMPSGVMLHGAPGTGKTLLAKALAGEAGIPFYATSGSDFVEKFAGVGASRVRELFTRARSHEGGAVVFIDEIDAVARARSSADTNGEREQTLNQILVELDGFSTTDRVVCIAATNRLDVLDPAVLRPGRFGRHIAVPLPAREGRAAILQLHAAGKPVDEGVSVDDLAESMGGLSGAQLADVVNEAAIMAGRAGAETIGRSHFREAYLRVLAGPKRRNAPLAEGELQVIAAHEAGHVLCAEYGERYEKARQVTIEPRGNAMGLAVYGQPDRALHDPDYLHEALVATLGGRAAEQLVFGRISSGAANDLQKATELARRAVEELGFSPRVGQAVSGAAPLSESKRAAVESEIERMVADAYADALSTLEAHRPELDRLTERLLEQRELERVDILAAIGRPGTERRTYPKPRVVPTPQATPIPLAAAEGEPA